MRDLLFVRAWLQPCRSAPSERLRHSERSASFASRMVLRDDPAFPSARFVGAGSRREESLFIPANFGGRSFSSSCLPRVFEGNLEGLRHRFPRTNALQPVLSHEGRLRKTSYCLCHSLFPPPRRQTEPRSKKVLRLSCRGVASARPGRRPHLRWKPPTSVGGAPPFKAARDGLPHNLRLQPRRICLLGNPTPSHRSMGPNRVPASALNAFPQEVVALGLPAAFSTPSAARRAAR